MRACVPPQTRSILVTDLTPAIPVPQIEGVSCGPGTGTFTQSHRVPHEWGGGVSVPYWK